MQGLHRRLPGVFYPDELRRLSDALDQTASPGETAEGRLARAAALLGGQSSDCEPEVLPVVMRLRALARAAGIEAEAADHLVERTVRAALEDLDGADRHPSIDHWLESILLGLLDRGAG